MIQNRNIQFPVSSIIVVSAFIVIDLVNAIYLYNNDLLDAVMIVTLMICSGWLVCSIVSYIPVLGDFLLRTFGRDMMRCYFIAFMIASELGNFLHWIDGMHVESNIGFSILIGAFIAFFLCKPVLNVYDYIRRRSRFVSHSRAYDN